MWDDLNLAASIFELRLGSVWERKTLTGVHIWDDLNLVASIFRRSLGSVWMRKMRTECIFGMI